ncbi:hypothetical protein DLAC_03825 [Tieghemostelium lacteum]|uniref:Right handed beta helix domain-containing protein n=1 Tax=Tieghemostelium lacteum TaxID=361077 RepID=A0A152A0Z7_TIELA|nr:hypothetical protein DLAC_03825 [Tieghemostelium lacteum]|eukprot:KYQ99873.1 hypothetical protein DLAC_03825 [Tieghemostelium lacteum]
MTKSYLLLLLLVVICNINIKSTNAASVIPNLGDEKCTIYISVNNAVNSSYSNCGSDNIKNPCPSLDLGVQSCINQSITGNMFFIFDNGTYELTKNQTLSFYNQFVTLVGDPSGGTIFDLSNIKSTVFSIIENTQTSKTTDVTSLNINQMNFQNYYGITQTTAGSIVYVNSSVCQTLISVVDSVFSNAYGESGVVFNLFVNDQHVAGKDPKTISVSVLNTNFTGISAESGAVFNAQYMVDLYLTSVIITNSSSNSSLIYSQFGGVNFQGLEISKSNVHFNGLIMIANDDEPTQVPVIEGSKFSDNYGAAGGNQSIILSFASTLLLKNSVFSNNSIPGLWVKYFASNLNTLSNVTFENSSGPVVVADVQSQLFINQCEFIGNSIATAQLHNYGIVTVTNADSIQIFNGTFTGNTGVSIYTNNCAQVEISNVISDDNKSTGLLNCLSSTVSLTGLNINVSISDQENTLYAHSVNCQEDCTLSSTDQQFQCSNQSNSSSDKRKPKLEPLDILFICIGGVVFLGLILFIVFMVKKYRHGKHDYHLLH